jgi:4-carboxymuconolactone decarboxylase
MAENQSTVKALVADMLSPEIAEAMANAGDSDEFAGELGKLAYDYVFGQLWARSALDRRSRSLVTLGILIALRATEELNFHFRAAINNGLTKREIEEVIYHASGYAGFPAAASARTLAAKIFAAPPISAGPEE